MDDQDNDDEDASVDFHFDIGVVLVVVVVLVVLVGAWMGRHLYCFPNFFVVVAGLISNEHQDGCARVNKRFQLIPVDAYGSNLSLIPALIGLEGGNRGTL
jgi:hypothetical protein